MATSDGFVFDVINDENHWLQNQFFQIDIIQNTLAAFAEATQILACHNDGNAIITITPTGGNAPLTYSLNGGAPQSENIFTDLGEGLYEVTVTDNFGFIVTTNSITISNPPAIILSVNVATTDITVMANGGTGNLQYSMDGTHFQSSNEFADQPNGTYTIYVMDENGCVETAQAIVAVNTLVITASQTQGISCFGESDGEITVEVGGGTPGFQYSINGVDFQASNIFQNVPAGDYTITVMDAEGFTQTDMVSISEPPAITVSTNVSADDITVLANGGTGNLQYSIDGTNFQSSNEFTDQPNGNYIIYIMDENGCMATTQAIVAVNTMIISASQTQGISCFGESDGEITVEVGGGTPGFQYSINGVDFQGSNIFQNLAAGDYTITVMDAIGFTQTDMVSIPNPPAITGFASANGYEIMVMANGGTGNLQYSIDGGPFQNNPVFYPIPAGDHNIIVLDENGCQLPLSANVNVTALNAQPTISQTLDCHDSTNGSITIEASGGVPPYEYSMNGGPFQGSNIFENLNPGDYTATIRDSGGFMFSATAVSIVAPPAISISADVDFDEIIVGANGGTGMLQYSIDGTNFQNSNIFTNVPNGDYTLTAQDENGCEVIISASVNVPALQAVATVGQPISCHNEMNGEISINASGGVPPLQYSLNGTDFQDSPVFSNLASGIYHPTVIDSIGQTLTTPDVSIENPDPVEATATTFGSLITVDAMGGTGNLTYSFDNMPFQSSNIFNADLNGTYDIVVMDENGCTDSLQVVVNKPEGLNFTFVQIDCADADNGEIFIEGVEGGYAPYQYSINNGPFSSETSYTGLAAGEYTITVMDSTGVLWMAPAIIIDAPPLLTATTDIFENNLTINADGGTGIWQYSIDGGQTFQDDNVFNGLPNGDYEVVVMDENGCTFTTSITIDYTSTNETGNGLLFEVTPNPSAGIFNLSIKTQAVSDLNITVHNAIGQIVHRSKLFGNGEINERLDLSFLSNGHYQLRVTDGEKWGREAVGGFEVNCFFRPLCHPERNCSVMRASIRDFLHDGTSSFQDDKGAEKNGEKMSLYFKKSFPN